MRGNGRGGANGGGAVHLLRLMRGLTPATIQDVAFSACGTLLSVSSARGTTHIYRLALPGAFLPCAAALYHSLRPPLIISRHDFVDTCGVVIAVASLLQEASKHSPPLMMEVILCAQRAKYTTWMGDWAAPFVKAGLVMRTSSVWLCRCS